MAKINFKTLTFKNFMSYGNKGGSITFDNTNTLITGTNGNGKSSIFIALFYGLYGKTYKKTKLGSLVNNTNNKDMLVEVSFESNGNEYLIRRGQKPNIFEMYENDKLIDQSASVSDYQDYLETYILKIPENVFRQLIFLGANVIGSKTFVDLTKAEKDELFQIITDTSVFAVMRDNISAKLKANKTELAEAKYRIEVLQESIQSEKANISKMEQHNAQATRLNEETSSNNQRDLDEIINKLSELYKEVEVIKELKPKYDKLMGMISELETSIREHNKELRGHEVNLSKILTAKNSFSNCIGCEKLKFISDIDLDNEDTIQSSIVSINETLLELNAKFKDYSEKQKKLYDKLLIGKSTKDTITSLEKSKEKLGGTMKRPQVAIMDIDYSKCIKQEEALGKYIKKKDKILQYSEDLTKLHKLIDNNNLKGVILNQQLPILNKYINLYLNEFNGIKFSFFIDQNFKENIVSKNKDIEFHSLSNGQSMRVSFSIMFAFLKLVEERSGIDTNLLAIDEALDSSLDKEGREELLGVIQKDFGNKSVFVISHNPDIINNIQDFDRMYTVENNGFSQLIEMR